MNGLFLLAAIGVATLGLLWLAKLRGPLLTLAATALMIGATGYALQGNPALDGQPSAAAGRAPPVPLTVARKALLGQFNAADTWMTISESYASRGATQDAAAVMSSAVRARPTDFAMWVGLGNALSDHARMLTPGAQFAFDRAAELAPGHPAPAFFLGLAEARSGQLPSARRRWRALLADAPAEASWRPLVEDALLALGE